MQIDLRLQYPLSQVVFVHGYLQLWFQDAIYTLYNLPAYTLGETVIRQGQPGFCDALVALLDQPVDIEYSSGKLSLHFQNGAVVSVENFGPNARGPEAWQFGCAGAPDVVEQNA